MWIWFTTYCEYNICLQFCQSEKHRSYALFKHPPISRQSRREEKILFDSYIWIKFFNMNFYGLNIPLSLWFVNYIFLLFPSNLLRRQQAKKQLPGCKKSRRNRRIRRNSHGIIFICLLHATFDFWTIRPETKSPARGLSTGLKEWKVLQ